MSRASTTSLPHFGFVNIFANSKCPDPSATSKAGFHNIPSPLWARQHGRKLQMARLECHLKGSLAREAPRSLVTDEPRQLRCRRRTVSPPRRPPSRASRRRQRRALVLGPWALAAAHRGASAWP
ncbi:hypothetical protein Pelo_13162 [Pelomyxa schiedti]|nr:hypothetical protein Pelo_13162 [Pelomyxa schiedti]